MTTGKGHPPRALRRIGVIGGIAFLTGCGSGAPSTPPLLVFAAANLQPAFEVLVPAFQEASGIEVDLVFGSSGQLASQIRNGAPADLFFSADESFGDTLVDEGFLDRDTRLEYALGRLALVSPAGGPLPTSPSALVDASYTIIAMANPEVSPYGRAAEQALRSTGVWEAIQPRLVYAGNVAQVLQMVRSGNADAAIVALGSILGPGSATPPFTLIDPAHHRPLLHTAGIVSGTARSTEALALLNFVTGEAGQTLLAQFGFDSPAAPEPR